MKKGVDEPNILASETIWVPGLANRRVPLIIWRAAILIDRGATDVHDGGSPPSALAELHELLLCHAYNVHIAMTSAIHSHYIPILTQNSET